MGLILGTEHLAANVNQPHPDHGHKRTPIKVALLSLPPRTQSLLEFFFSNAGRGSFAATIEEQADTAIFDLDTQASRDHWVIYNARTGRPGIALAVKPQEVPGAIWVQKPVTPAALLAAAASLRAGPLSGAAPVPPEPTPAPWVAEPVPQSPAPTAPAAPAASAVLAPMAPVAQPEVLPVFASQLNAADAAPTPALQTVVSPEPPKSEAPAYMTAPAEPAETASASTESAPFQAAQSPDPAVIAHPVAPEQADPNEPAVDPQLRMKSFWQRLFGTAPRATSGSVDLELPLAGPTATADVQTAAEAANPEPAQGLSAEQAVVEPSPAVSQPATSASTTYADAAPPSDDASAAQVSEAALPTVSATESLAVDVQVTPASVSFAPTQPQLAPPSAEVDLLLEAMAVPATEDASLAFFGPRKGPASDADAASPTQRYEPESYLIGALREAYLVASKWQVPTQIDCEQGAIVVDAERNEVHCGLADEALQALASHPLGKRSKVQTLTKLEYGNVKQVLQARNPAAGALRLDDTLWRCALWASAGRMPAGTDATRTVYLRHWPNLTRLTALPQAARLSAMWALRGSSVVDSARQFKIEQRFVIGFFNGVWALNLLTDDGSHVRRAQRKGARNRGLLTRLLGWLRG